MALLNTEAKQQVVDAVARVEALTSGEIVVAVIPRSDDYAAPRALLATSVALSLGWALYVLVPSLHSAWAFASQPLVGIVAWYFSAWPPLLRRLVPRHKQREAVDRRTKWTFIQHGLTETRERNAVLILVSEAERQIQILADRGIYERTRSSETGDLWQAEVQRIAAALREGRPADGLCAAVASIGEKLVVHFPHQNDDSNELPNEILELR